MSSPEISIIKDVILSGVRSDEGGSNGVEGSLVEALSYSPEDPSTARNSAIAPLRSAQNDIVRVISLVVLLFVFCFSSSFAQDRLAHYLQFAHPIGTAQLDFPGPNG